MGFGGCSVGAELEFNVFSTTVHELKRLGGFANLRDHLDGDPSG